MNAFKEIRTIIFITLGLGAAFLVYLFFVKGVSFAKIKEAASVKEMWAAKATTHKDLDFVVIGDSRVYRGFNPEVVQQKTQLKGINLGFSSAGFSTPLFDLAEKHLKSAGPRIIVIGLTPHSLTDEAAANKHLMEWVKKPFSERQTILLLEPFIIFASSEVLSLDNTDPNYIQNYTRSGFVASDYKTRNQAEALKSYRETFTKYGLSKNVIETLKGQIAKWKAEGIQVYFYIPPVAEELHKLEDELTGFYSSEIPASLVQAGAEQIPLSNNWISYDGSHLIAEHANRLSTEVADFINSKTKN